MAWVPPIVEFSPTTNPLATPVWVDISAYVVGNISITRGRTSEFQTFTAGQCSLTLDNSTRRFDPSYASGPYFGNLRARKKLRIRSNDPAGSRTLFTGYITGWPQSMAWQTNRDVVSITAVDALSVLAQLKVDYLGYGEQVRSDGAVVYRPIGNASQGISTAVDDLLDNVYSPIGLNGAFFWYVEDNAFKALSPYSVAFQAYGGGLPIGQLWASAPAAQSLEFWVKLDPGQLGATATSLVSYIATPPDTGAVIDVTTNGRLTRGTVTTARSIADGSWHHVVWTSNGTTLSVYVDGKLSSSAASALPVFVVGTGPNVTTYVFCSGPGVGPASTARVREIAVYSVALTATQVANHYASATGWDGDTSGQRIGRLLDLAGWPSADRSIDVGGAVVPSVDRVTGTALDLCQTVAVADGGGLWVDPAGLVTFRSRLSRNEVAAYNTVQATFGNSGSDHRYIDAQPAQDDALIKNTISVSRQGGLPYKFTNATSIARYLPISDDSSTNLYLANDNDVISRGQWLIENYADPSARLEYVTVNARHTSTLATLVTDLDIWEKVAVKVPHAGGVGTTTTYTISLEFLSHDIDVYNLQWITKFGGPPALATTYFILGTHALGSAVPIAY
jgi:Concanavalin A-like lectin/glucanases superfamily